MKVSIESNVLIGMARAGLRKIRRLRQEEWEVWIANRIESRNLWRRFFPWLKPLTPADAERAIRDKSSREYGSYLPDNKCSYEERVCLNAMNMTYYATRVLLDHEEFNALLKLI